jgi:hypothetical protein
MLGGVKFRMALFYRDFMLVVCVLKMWAPSLLHAIITRSSRTVLRNNAHIEITAYEDPLCACNLIDFVLAKNVANFKDYKSHRMMDMTF